MPTKPEIFAAVEEAGWPALLIDGASTIRCANASARTVFGKTVEGSPLSSLWPPDAESAGQFLAQWEKAPTPFVSLRLQPRGGTPSAYQAWICACAWEGQKHFLVQLLHSGATPAGEGSLAQKQKLDCALQLARTVALDFNNALTSILGHTSHLLSRAEPTHPWRASLMEVEKSAAKAAEISNDLGMFSRQEKEARAQASGNLNSLLQRSVEYCQQNAAKTELTWGLQLERRLYSAKFDEAKMQQALLKIFENALQALGANGRITVQTRNLDLTAPTQDRNVQLAPGAYVCAEISDNGSGIAPEVLPRIFEPFFTTKRSPHRGLGLAWVYGIVTNHGGGVAVSSQPGAGTSVRIYLPAEQRIVQENHVAPNDLRGTQTLLFVDDEDLILTMGHTILSAYGYEVLTAASGQKALDLLSQRAKPVDLVITDLVMPAMSGRELVEHISRQCPGTPFLCMSGYSWPASQREETAYLQKPFTAQELLLKVKQVLASAR
jgi:nitrogen-specific signal transduction histidine kinase/CheY-like chemotaxis protein